MEPNGEPQFAPPARAPGDWVARAQAFLEVIILAGVASSLLASVPFAMGKAGQPNLLSSVRVLSSYLLLEAAVTFVLLFLIMRAHRETLKDFGLTWRSWRSNALLGLAIVPILFFLNIVVSGVFQVFFPRYSLDRNPLTDLVRTQQDLGLFILTALIAGGIKEELQRAFILRRFRAHLGGANLGLIIWSVVFAVGHYVQGVQGMIAAGIFGLIFGIAYLARGNLIVPVVAHGAYDTVALLGFWFFSSPR